MTVKDIFFGTLDAKHELLSGRQKSISDFERAFCIPPNISLDDYVEGKRFFVTGLKGTGKTAFLWYISILKNQRSRSDIEFIFFKETFDQAEKKKLSLTVNEVGARVGKKTAALLEDDYEIPLRWFFYCFIYSKIKQTGNNPFCNNETYEEFEKVLNSEKFVWLKSLIPPWGEKLSIVDNKISFDLDFDTKKKNEFVQTVKNADLLFERLRPSSSRGLFIFCDEIEFGIGDKKQRSRDAKIIRDFIATITRINLILKKNQINSLIYAGIRSEVLSQVDCIGKEINKSIADFSREIHWISAGHDESKQPLLQIIVRRLATYEHNTNPSSNGESIFDNYFPTSIKTRPMTEYILHNSWYRPRDIIRLLTLAQNVSNEQEKFTEKNFLDIRKEYSKLSWDELSEELLASLGVKVLKAIPILFQGGPSEFDMQSLMQHINAKRELYPEVDDIFKYHKIQYLLTKLYTLGIIGNIKPNGGVRLAFRGDLNLQLEYKMFIHYGLRNFFETT